MRTPRTDRNIRTSSYHSSIFLPFFSLAQRSWIYSSFSKLTGNKTMANVNSTGLEVERFPWEDGSQPECAIIGKHGGVAMIIITYGLFPLVKYRPTSTLYFFKKFRHIIQTLKHCQDSVSNQLILTSRDTCQRALHLSPPRPVTRLLGLDRRCDCRQIPILPYLILPFI